MKVVQLYLTWNKANKRMDFIKKETTDIYDDGDRYVVNGWDVFKDNVGEIIKSDGQYLVNLINPSKDKIKEVTNYMINEMRKEIKEVIKVYENLIQSLDELKK